MMQIIKIYRYCSKVFLIEAEQYSKEKIALQHELKMCR